MNISVSAQYKIHYRAPDGRCDYISDTTWAQVIVPELTQVDTRITHNVVTTYLTLSEAAAISDRSRVTLRRYLDAKRFPNARQDTQDANRAWLIPLEDLESAGAVVVGDAGRATRQPGVDAARVLIVKLAVAEALAEERSAEIRRLEAAFAALTSQAKSVAGVATDRGGER